jgi:hypothetical protein
MIANGGADRPHLLDQVEEPGPRGWPSFRHTRRRRRSMRTSTPRCSTPSRPAYGAARQQGRRARSLTFPTVISREDGTAEVRPGLGLLDQSWFCGYGPSTSGQVPTIALCVVIENGASAPRPPRRRLKIFREYFHENGGDATSKPLD